MPRSAIALFLVALVVGCGGCATRRPAIPPGHGPALAPRPDGQDMVVSWASSTGEVYTVQFTEQLSPAEWQPLAGYTGVKGTGGLMEARDPAPNRPQRFYRLEVRRLSGDAASGE